MNILLTTLIYLSILRISYYPVFGERASVFSGFLSILLSFILFISFKLTNSTKIIVYYSIILLFVTFSSNNSNLNINFIGFLETITPYLIIGITSSFYFIQYSKKYIKFFRKSVIYLLFILLFGQILNLLGVPLPSLVDIPISGELKGLTLNSFRVTSFVGTSGPYAMTLNYLLIALQIANPKYFIQIFFTGCLILLFTFSRLGLAIFIIYNLIYFILKFLSGFNSNLFYIRKNLFIFLIILMPIVCILFVNSINNTLFVF